MKSKITLENEKGYIPSDLYEQIVRRMPIPSIEAMIVFRGLILFMRRRRPPAKGQLWFPGGRIRKGEKLEQTLHREVKQETGLKIEIKKLIGVYSRIFPERHDVTIAFMCHSDNGDVILDNEHSDFKFLDKIPKGLHPYLLRVILDSDWTNMTKRNKY